MPSLSRRGFVRAGLASSLLLPGMLSEARASAGIKKERGRARNVIFMVSDGMSLGTLVLAERYRTLFKGKGTHWLGTYDRPDLRRALMDTASLNSLVTDSAAAASAWGCGHRVNNGAVNTSPEGKQYETIFDLSRSAGVATGLVTTATVTHATPSGFATHAVSRTLEQDIAAQYRDEGLSLIFGGGAKFFDPAQRPDHQDVLGDFQRKGYSLLRDRDSLLSACGTKPLLGLFDDGHLPLMIDQTADPEVNRKIPTLCEMTSAALKHLLQAPKGFILQIEGGHVDSAAHNNDVGALIAEQLAFDDAIGVVLDFIKDRDDTLLIMTSDHGVANPCLNGVGGSFTSLSGAYGATGACFERISRFKHSNVWIMKELSAESTPSQVRDRVKEATDIELEAEDVELMCLSLQGKYRPAYRVGKNRLPLVTLGRILSNYVSIGWAGTDHTSDFTELAALGPGSESIRGVVLNNRLFTVMKEALGV